MKSIFTLLLMSFSSLLISQSIIITGVVTDTENIPLISASVVALSAKDSTIVSFGLSNNEGDFKIGRLKKEKYILQVTYLGYLQLNEPIDLTQESGSVDIGQLRLKIDANQLDEVIIKGENTPIIVKKDTLEYNAAAFETRPQDVVEDLLRQMPGIEVEDDGTIIAQGEEVKKVTVDGKDFFGNDPKVATKNISAEAIKSVQFFDRKSDMAEFSGVDDGEREKTMNLNLKEGYKSGYFGNVGLAGGTQERYDGNLNLNRFGPKSQVSFIGNFNNINRQGFSVDQYMSFMNNMGGFGGRNSSGGNLNISRGLSDGFVNTNAGGVNLNYDFSDKTELNLSYFINDIGNTVDKTSVRENFLSNDRSFLSNEESGQFSSNTGHSFRMKLEHEIDSSQDIRLETNISIARSDINSNALSNTVSEGAIQNNSITDYLSNGANDNLSGSLLYRKKLHKTKNRTFSISGSLNSLESEMDGTLESENNYLVFDPARAYAETIAQNQLERNDQTNYSIRSSYVEPLSASNYIELIYRRQNFDNEVARDVYDVLNGTQSINEGLSNNYNRNYVYDRYGLAYHWNGQATSFSLEGMMQHSRLDGLLLDEGTRIQNTNNAILPRLQLRHELGQAHNMSVRYSTSVGEPSIEQLQPIVDNSDPLNIYTGNPDLVPEYRHNLRLNYIKFDQFSFTSLFAFINASYTTNNIVNQTNVDEQFIRSTKPVNVDYDFNVSGNITYSRPIRPLAMKVRLNTNLTYRRNILFINELENKANRYIARVGLTLDNRNKKKVDVSAGITFNYNINNYDLSENLNQSFLNQTYNGDLIVKPSDRWSFDSSIRVRYFDQQNFGSSQTIPILNAGLAVNFLKGNRGELKLSVVDLLNRNLGISRSANLNYLENEETLSLGRYGMLSFKYQLRASGKESKSGGMRMMRH